MQRRHDREPISVGLALSVGPPLVSAILFLGRQIHSTIVAYELNEKNCNELDEHVFEVIRCLESIPPNHLNDENFHQPLMNLEVCLTECLELVQKFSDASSLEQLLRSRTYKNRFDKLKAQLVSGKERLTFAMGVHSFVLTAKLSNSDGQHHRTPLIGHRHRLLTPSVDILK
ncbi:hypothetical protein I4U23_015421 [Adineta vaga]|nr:hypothetical protein I4U23_015421 [Adineta vaga]